MFQVKRELLIVEKHLGGSEPPESFSDDCYEWLDQAAIAAQKLFTDPVFRTVFTRYAWLIL